MVGGVPPWDRNDERRHPILLLAALVFVMAVAVSCGGGSSPSQTPSPPPGSSASVTPAPGTPTPRSPDVPEGAAVLLSLGDYLQYGCCSGSQPDQQPAFATYLSDSLKRPLQYVTLAGDETATDFIAGVNGARPSQLDRAVSAIAQYQQSGHPVVAVLLSIGAKEFEALRRTCQAPCDNDFSRLLARYNEQMGVVYSRLNQALSTPTPILET